MLSSDIYSFVSPNVYVLTKRVYSQGWLCDRDHVVSEKVRHYIHQTCHSIHHSSSPIMYQGMMNSQNTASHPASQPDNQTGMCVIIYWLLTSTKGGTVHQRRYCWFVCLSVRPRITEKKRTDLHETFTTCVFRFKDQSMTLWG